MRGSPLLRFFLLALALSAAAAGIAKVTSPRAGAAISDKSPEPTGTKTAVKNLVPFRLILSDPASSIVMEALETTSLPPGDGTVSGTIELDAKSPTLGLTVRWKNAAAAGEHRFAKLTLEAAGQPTFTHVFDSDGDIDDFIELPFTSTR